MSSVTVGGGAFHNQLAIAEGATAKTAMGIHRSGLSTAKTSPVMAVVATHAARMSCFRWLNVMVPILPAHLPSGCSQQHTISPAWDDGLVPPSKPAVASGPLSRFDLTSLLHSAGAAFTTRKYAKSAVIFPQGDGATEVFYVQHGRVKLSVLSRAGKEAVVAILTQGEFFGEGCLADQPRRIATATAIGASTILVIPRGSMLDLLHTQPTFAERFLAHMLARNIRIEEDLVDLLFNPSEKRLARGLLLLARYGKQDQPLLIPAISQETLAEMIGTTRSRVNFFMNKFRELGFIEYSGGDIKVNSSLLTVILHD